MKCRKLECGAEAAPGQGYCSREHAPYANLSNQAPPEKTVKAILKSITPARGEHQKPSSVAELRSESGKRGGEVLAAMQQRPELKSGGTTVRTESASTPTSARSGISSQSSAELSFQKHGWNEEELRAKLKEERGELGMPKTETATLSKSAPAAIVETLPAKLEEQSSTSSAEPLISMHLIDDSVTHLHGLMKGIASEAREAEKRRLDPAMVNAACNCAKNIYGLMRLKFDVVKASRGRRA